MLSKQRHDSDGLPSSDLLSRPGLQVRAPAPRMSGGADHESPEFATVDACKIYGIS